MSELINALDNYTNIKFGENGHVEFDWSNSLQEKILQFSFQIVRNNTELESFLRSILMSLSNSITSKKLPEREVAFGYLSLLYKMIGQTRDIIDGKGEYKLTYMMIYVWNEFYPELAQFALKCMVNLNDNRIHPYGSWKDIKYFCKYCFDKGMSTDSSLIQYAINITNEQLKNDYLNLRNNNIKDISLASKWIPREKPFFSKLYELLAVNYFNQYLITAQTVDKIKKAVLKCKTEYRKILSTLNKTIDTVQIKQCSRNWSIIDFNKVTSITLTKQKKAFLNIKKANLSRIL
jgi:hypothetical protein